MLVGRGAPGLTCSSAQTGNSGDAWTPCSWLLCRRSTAMKCSSASSWPIVACTIAISASSSSSGASGKRRASNDGDARGRTASARCLLPLLPRRWLFACSSVAPSARCVRASSRSCMLAFALCGMRCAATRQRPRNNACPNAWGWAGRYRTTYTSRQHSSRPLFFGDENPFLERIPFASRDSSDRNSKEPGIRCTPLLWDRRDMAAADDAVEALVVLCPALIIALFRSHRTGDLFFAASAHSSSNVLSFDIAYRSFRRYPQLSGQSRGREGIPADSNGCGYPRHPSRESDTSSHHGVADRQGNQTERANTMRGAELSVAAGCDLVGKHQPVADGPLGALQEPAPACQELPPCASADNAPTAPISPSP